MFCQLVALVGLMVKLFETIIQVRKSSSVYFQLNKYYKNYSKDELLESANTYPFWQFFEYVYPLRSSGQDLMVKGVSLLCERLV